MNDFTNSLFNAEEMIYLNSASKNLKLMDLTRDRILQSLGFTLNITNDDDTVTQDFINGIMSTITNMDEEMWSNVKSCIPFKLPYEEDSEPLL